MDSAGIWRESRWTRERKGKSSMKAVGIRKAVELFGGTDIEIKKGYHYQYGFFVKDGQLYYVNTGDDRMLKNGELDIYYRTAKDRNDFTGGQNLRGFNYALNRMGCSVSKFPKTKERN